MRNTMPSHMHTHGRTHSNSFGTLRNRGGAAQVGVDVTACSLAVPVGASPILLSGLRDAVSSPATILPHISHVVELCPARHGASKRPLALATLAGGPRGA